MRHFDIILRNSSSESLAIKLHKHIIEAGVTIRTIPMRYYISASQKMILKEHGIRAALAKLISLDPSLIEMRANCNAKTLRTMFTSGCNSLLLTSDTTNIHSEKMTGTTQNSLYLSELSLRAFITLSAQCENNLHLIESAIENSVLKRFSKINAQSTMKTSMHGFGQSEKFESVNNALCLDQNVQPTSVKPVGGEINVMQLGSHISQAYLTKYRTLGEMDSDGTTNYTLQEFDNITLEDLDYIVV